MMKSQTNDKIIIKINFFCTFFCSMQPRLSLQSSSSIIKKQNGQKGAQKFWIKRNFYIENANPAPCRAWRLSTPREYYSLKSKSKSFSVTLQELKTNNS